MSGVSRERSAATSALHNQENVLSRLRGSMKPRAAANENQENPAPKQGAAGSRTVLGALQNNLRSKAQNQCEKQVSVGTTMLP